MPNYKSSPTRKRDDIIVGRALLPEREQGGWAVPGGHSINNRQSAIAYAARMDQIMSANARAALPYIGRKAA